MNDAPTSFGCPRCGRPVANPAELCANCRVPAGDATVLGTSASDATVLGARANDATSLGSPPSPDASRLSQVDHDATVLGRPATRGSASLTVGDTFGRYTIVRLLGQGGMGAVYQAWDNELEVVVALKVIRPETLRDPAAEAEIERRFKRELLLARQVTHKNVVRIYDLGEIDGIKYITMSYVEGRELAALLKEHGRLPIPETLRIMRDVLSGLGAAHAAGVIHRDLKPANIMIGNDGDVLIMDFGIARSAGSPEPAKRSATPATPEVSRTSSYTQATVVGSIIGTVEYMAPEQARGDAIDHRADIYTFGLIFYDMLVGKRRDSGTAMDQLRQRMAGVVPPLKTLAPDVPDALAAVITRAIKPDPGDRYQTTSEMAAALERLDPAGNPKPVRRVIGMPIAAAVALLLTAVGASAWYYAATRGPDVQPPPVSVVIADFENTTGEAAFDRTLEPNLRRALEGAGFITAFDRVGIARTVGVRQLPEKLDETAARELAARQGLGIVLSGSVAKSGGRYQIQMKATDVITGKVLADISDRASDPAGVLATATEMVGEVRQELGDRTTDDDPIFAQRSLSTSSFEVLRLYAAAQEASASNKWAEVRDHLLKAVELDPEFGLGYLLLSGASRNLGRGQEASAYVDQAMAHTGKMTTREKLTTRGMFFRLQGDYEQCLREQQDLIKAFAADVTGRNQFALCASKLRQLDRARDEMKVVTQLLPKRSIGWDNYALYSSYSGQFAEGEEAARTAMGLEKTDPFAPLALGLAQMGQDRPAEAIATFIGLGQVPGPGATFSASGLADVALYQGRYSEAVRIAEEGAQADLKTKGQDRAAAKLMHQAYAHLQAGRKPAAVASSDRALELSKQAPIRFLAARIFLEAAQPAKAQPLAAGLAAEKQPEPRSYALILQAMMSRAANNAAAAVSQASEAIKLLDTWIAHFELGRAYYAAGQFAQADAEFDRCLTRRGEALSLFLDEEPTFGYLPAVHFFQGLTREGMKLPDAAASFREYLRIREAAGEDPLLADLRRRLAK